MKLLFFSLFTLFFTYLLEVHADERGKEPKEDDDLRVEMAIEKAALATNLSFCHTLKGFTNEEADILNEDFNPATLSSCEQHINDARTKLPESDIQAVIKKHVSGLMLIKNFGRVISRARTSDELVDSVKELRKGFISESEVKRNLDLNNDQRTILHYAYLKTRSQVEVMVDNLEF